MKNLLKLFKGVFVKTNKPNWKKYKNDLARDKLTIERALQRYEPSEHKGSPVATDVVIPHFQVPADLYHIS